MLRFIRSSQANIGLAGLASKSNTNTKRTALEGTRIAGKKDTRWRRHFTPGCCAKNYLCHVAPCRKGIVGESERADGRRFHSPCGEDNGLELGRVSRRRVKIGLRLAGSHYNNYGRAEVSFMPRFRSLCHRAKPRLTYLYPRKRFSYPFSCNCRHCCRLPVYVGLILVLCSRPSGATYPRNFAPTWTAPVTCLSVARTKLARGMRLSMEISGLSEDLPKNKPDHLGSRRARCSLDAALMSVRWKAQ